MGAIITSVWDTLLWIFNGTPEAIMNEFKSSHKSLSPEDQIVEKTKRQSSTIQSQQDRMIYQVSKISEQSRVIRELKDLIQKKDKEIYDLKNRIRSLEIEIFELRSRLKRTR